MAGNLPDSFPIPPSHPRLEKPRFESRQMSSKRLTGVELKIFSKVVNGNLRRNGNGAAALPEPRAPVDLQKQPRADAEDLAEPSCLGRADRSLPVQGLMHVAALSENGLEVRSRLPGVFQQELELFGGGAMVGWERVPAVVVLDQQDQQAHQFGLFGGAGTRFA